MSQLDGLGAMLHAVADGLQHPFATPAHVIALAGLALIAARKKRDAIEIAFALGLAIGLGALVRGVRNVPADEMLLAGATLCGLLAVSSVTVPVVLAAPVAFLFGGALGLDSALAAGTPGEMLARLIGTACGAVVALALMAFLAFRIARPWRGALLRAAGSGIAAIALLALVLRWADVL